MGRRRIAVDERFGANRIEQRLDLVRIVPGGTRGYVGFVFGGAYRRIVLRIAGVLRDSAASCAS